MNSKLITANQNWLTEYPFTVFHTVTWPGLKGRVNSIPGWAAEQLISHLREINKKLRITLGAMGFITLGHSGHLHSHLLMLEKNAKPLSAEQLKLMESSWDHQARTLPIDDVKGVAGYAASYKHLGQTAAYEEFEYGATALNRQRLH